MEQIGNSPVATSVRVASATEAAVARLRVLPVAHYRLRWEAAQRVEDSQYLGSAWRGVFGHALKRLVCVTRAPQCTGCMLLHSCSYPYLFETPGEASAPAGATEAAAPHPLILRMETARCEAGEDYVLGMVLVGRAIPFLGYAVRALENAAEHGVSTREYRFRLRMVSQESPTGSGAWLPILGGERRLQAFPPAAAAIPARPSRVRIRLLSPLRLRKQGVYVHDEATLGEFAASLVRRLLLMLRFHGSGAVDADLGALFHAARAWQPESASLRWHDWTRYSNRQQTRMQMGGVMGHMVVSTDQVPDLWPWLWIGQYTHAGKAASMGLGCYRLEKAE